METNRLGLSLLEEDTGVPENITKKFQKRLRNVDAAVAVDDSLTLAASKKSVKRKAGGDLADSDEQKKIKRTKLEQTDSASKKVKEVSL